MTPHRYANLYDLLILHGYDPFTYLYDLLEEMSILWQCIIANLGQILVWYL